MLVTALTGKKLMSGDEEAGEIDDVIINLEKGRASALLDPNDEYTGSDRKLIIGFGQIFVPGPEQPLATSLTREQLRRATPSAVDWWIASTPGPYVWNGDSRSAVIDGQDRRRVQRATETEPIRGRRSAQVIRGAVSLSQELSDHARRNVSVEEQGGHLVVSGQVESQDMKEKVAEVVARAAEGRWEIDNRLTVQSSAE